MKKESIVFLLRRIKRDPLSVILVFFVFLGATVTIGSLFYLLSYILIRGIPNLRWSLFSLPYTSENVSLVPAFVNTILIIVLALIFTIPLGVFAAIYLTEYAKKGNKLVKIVRITAETLAGIPSIIFGLFGMLFFVITLRLGYSLISGALTVSIMILPLVIRTSEEALHAVPDSYREGSYGLGAGKMRTVFRVVVPSAVPGILAGVILSIGRIVGETAALIYTAGTVAELPKSILSSGRTLAVHMYALTTEGLYVKQAFATAVVLVLVVMLINAISGAIARRISKG